MATQRQTIRCVLMTLLCLWARTVHSSLATTPVRDGEHNSPKLAAQHRQSEARQQTMSLREDFPQAYQIPAPPNSAPTSSGSADAMSVTNLELRDGVRMPPRIEQFASAYFNMVVDGSEKQIKDAGVDASAKQENRRRVKRSGYGYVNSYGGSSYGGYGGGYGGYGGGNGGYGGGYGGDSYSYGGDGQSYGGRSGGSYGYGGLKDLVSGAHGYKGLHLPNKVSYSHGYTKSPLISFVKGFKPGKTYVDKGHVIRNYFRHGSYNVALQHYKLIPTVKVVPYTTYKKIGVGQKVEAKYRYKAYICKYCYHGYPKIDVYEMKKPYSYAVRRFVYLPKDYNLDGYGHGNGNGNGGDGYGYGGYGYGNGGDGYGNGGNNGYGYGRDSYGYGGYGNGGDNGYGYGGDSYGYGGYGNGGDNGYGYGGDSYGYGGDSNRNGGYGYGGNNNGYGGDSYGYGGNGYGYGGNDYGYGGNSYGNGGNSYGNGGNSYGYGGNGYGYGGNSYGNGGKSYGSGGNSYGYGGNSYGYGGRSYSNGNSYDYGGHYGKAKVTYHEYQPQGYSGYGNSGSYGYHKK